MSNIIIDGLDNVIIIVRFSEKNLKFIIPYTTSIVDLKDKVLYILCFIEISVLFNINILIIK